jgi:hypothetical protein
LEDVFLQVTGKANPPIELGQEEPQ